MVPPVSTPERMSAATEARWKQKQKRDTSRYLRGPIPLQWIGKASMLPGKALAVGLMVWFFHGLTGQLTVQLRPSIGEKFGLTRYAMWRGLHQLEVAGLVTVDRQRGRCPEVTLKGVRLRNVSKDNSDRRPRLSPPGMETRP
jgi:hypothetical protein